MAAQDLIGESLLEPQQLLLSAVHVEKTRPDARYRSIPAESIDRSFLRFARSVIGVLLLGSTPKFGAGGTVLSSRTRRYAAASDTRGSSRTPLVTAS